MPDTPAPAVGPPVLLTPTLVAALLAAGPRRWRLASAWTLHTAVADLDETARDQGLLDRWDRHPVFDTGWGRSVSDTARAVAALLDDGLLVVEGTHLDAEYVTPASSMRALRKELWRLQPADARLVDQTGRSWATRASASRMNAATVRSSSPAANLSGSPANRRAGEAVGR